MLHPLPSMLNDPDVVLVDDPPNVSSGRIAILSLACHRMPTDVGYAIAMPTFLASCAAASAGAKAIRAEHKYSERRIRMLDLLLTETTAPCARDLFDHVLEDELAHRHVDIAAARPRSILGRGRVGVHRDHPP